MSTALLLLVLASTSPLPVAPTALGSETTGRVALGLPSPNPSSNGGGTLAASIAETWTPIDTLPFTITVPGGYYLVGNLVGASGTDGITVATSEVVIDLNGFRLSGGDGTHDGIRANPGTNRIRVRNGFVTSWGQDGIDLQTADQTVLEGLTLFGNTRVGLRCGSQARVVDCNAEANGLAGIATTFGGVVERCNAFGNKDAGFALGQGAVISNSVASGNHGDGFTGSGSLIRGCLARGNEGHGFVANSDSHVLACAAELNRGDGIRLGTNGVARENSCHSNGNGAGSGAGIHSISSGCRIDGNHVGNNDRGIEASSGSSLIVRNSAIANGANYALAAGNSVGPILTAAGIATSSNPHANHSL